MTLVQTEKPGLLLDIDPLLLQSVVQGVQGGFSMTGLKPTPIGASRLFGASQSIAVIVGLCGQSNGTITINLSERALLHIASQLTGEEEQSITESNLDAIGEVGNMIAGCTKDALHGTDYEITNISVPSLILGANYDFYFTRGFNTVSVEFELPGIPVTYQRDRFFTVTISLLRRILK